MQKANPWCSLSLGNGMWAAIPSSQIEEAFPVLFEEAGKPMDMAVFTRNESEGRLHCEVIAYFSPAAHGVAEVFDAEACEKPSRAGLGLLAGDPSCWVFFFPDGNP